MSDPSFPSSASSSGSTGRYRALRASCFRPFALLLCASPNEFRRARLHASAARPFTIRAPGAAAGKFYVQSARLNGKPLKRPWITTKEILDGGELIFVMGDRPNKEWARAPDAAPPSLPKR